MEKLLKIVVAMSLIYGCASRLPNKKKTASPETEKATVVDLETGADVIIPDYKKKWLLLYFHSKNCTSCVEKMKVIRDTVTASTFSNDEFELIAVSTDPIALTPAVKNFALQNNFSFLKWIDDRGAALKGFYLEGDVGVPFAVFLEDGEALWHYTNKDSFSVPELIARIKESVPKKDLPDTDPKPEKDFKLFTPSSTEMLSKKLARAEFTVVNTFSDLCMSCFDELRAWSAAGQAFDLCQKPKCQFINVENGYPEDEDFSQRFPRLLTLLHTENVEKNVGLVLDPVLSEQWESRFFDGYLSSKFPEWGGVFGTVIYNKKGEIVWNERAGDPEVVTEKIKELVAPVPEGIK